MKFEIKRIKSNVHVNVNGVVSAAFARQYKGGAWVVFVPQIAQAYDTLEDALATIAAGMDTWYTVSQAAERLVELGAFAEPPSAQLVGGRCREGKFPGAFKLLGPGGRGSGGAWRIPEKALQALANERRKG